MPLRSAQRSSASRRFANLVVVCAGVLLFWFAGCGGPPPSRPDREARERWIGETLSRLTLREKIGQMVMSRAYGYYYSGESDEYRRLEHLVRDQKFGGLVFFQGDVYETALLANRLQQMSDVPLLIASDFEWGPAMRIRRGTRFPEAMAVAATRDTLLAYRMGLATAREARAIGVVQDFAPVADVNSNPENPIINTRSFGEDPRLVADMSSAFAAGLQAGGVLATAKHFPGHGDTRTDSHLDLPLVGASRSRLDSVDLYPFRQLVRRGVSSVMIAHLEIPALEPREVPSTLSPKIVTGLLRGELGFDGLIVTDAMDMGGVVNRFGADSSAVFAVEAGVDLLLILPDEDAAVEALAHAVASGRIPEARIDRSVRRILGAKWDLGLVQRRTVDPEAIPKAVGTPENLALAKEIARRSVTLLRNDGVVPVGRAGQVKILNVIVADQEEYQTGINRTTSPWTSEPAGDWFTAQLRRRASNVQTVRIDPLSNAIDADSLLRKARRADVIVCPVFTRVRSGSTRWGLAASVVAAIDSMTHLQKPSVLIAMGSPYVLGSFPDARAALCTYSEGESASEAAVEAIFGESAMTGRLPVTIPGMYRFGDGIVLDQSVLRRDPPEADGFDRDSLARLDTIMERAIADSAFPGGQLVVARNGAVVYSRAFGRQTYGAASPPVTGSTLYDLASLTKVVATTSAVMRLYDEGRLRLDDRVTAYIPEFANHGKEQITLLNLLVHNGGLPPFKRLFLTCTSPQQVMDSVFQTEMIYRTGDSSVYSDFDFILLGEIVRRVTGVPLDRYADSVFFRPLGMTRTMFRPDSSFWPDTAPTEYDSTYRKTLVRGVVHDENAYALGGVSGHAGLFSTASDLALFCQMILNGGHYGGRTYLKPETVRLFTTQHDTVSSRALGWDTRSPAGYSSAGRLFSTAAFGHTGFTGTSIWCDPLRNVFVILLTNRVYPTRATIKIFHVRPAVHDAVMQALGLR